MSRKISGIDKVAFYYQKYGIKGIIKRLYIRYNFRFFYNNIISYLSSYFLHKKLQQILAQHSNLPLIVYLPFLSWNIPLYQRPQHLALALGEQDFLFLFITNNTLDNIHTIKKLGKNCFLVPPSLYNGILSLQRKKTLFTYSNPAKIFSIKMIDEHLKRGDNVIYDYLDDLNEEIFGPIDDYVLDRHKYMLSNERVICLTTANKLFNEAQKYRTKNVFLAENAVDLHHYANLKQPIERLEKIKGSKIIGYFGALSAWVDFELIIKLASQNPDKYILLIGYVYDKTIDKYHLERYENIIITGTIPYHILPNYAQYFDVSVIPFLINETTLATSPLKLFEYMALGKPIVTTALPECRKYKSPFIANTHEEFITLVNQALALSLDNDYFKILQQEAQHNSWEARAKVIQQAICENLNETDC
ncbi:MAG: glycosyltransferase [Gammaproteobacteria bacterium]|nr:glycosyltransferase [Gammaproteobacteria bacterium]